MKATIISTQKIGHGWLINQVRDFLSLNSTDASFVYSLSPNTTYGENRKTKIQGSWSLEEVSWLTSKKWNSLKQSSSIKPKRLPEEATKILRLDLATATGTSYLHSVGSIAKMTSCLIGSKKIVRDMENCQQLNRLRMELSKRKSSFRSKFLVRTLLPWNCRKSQKMLQKVGKLYSTFWG
jgi:hypothetical protein